MYAEAAPEEFLELVEADLASNNSGVMKLMAPVVLGIVADWIRARLRPSFSSSSTFISSGS